MKRRTLMRKLGAAGIGAAAVSGAATVKRPPVSALDIEGELDVSSVDGETTLAELLEPRELESLLAGVDASQYTVSVAPEADSVTVQDCCHICCSQMVEIACDCTCCVCDSESCN